MIGHRVAILVGEADAKIGGGEEREPDLIARRSEDLEVVARPGSSVKTRICVVSAGRDCQTHQAKRS